MRVTDFPPFILSLSHTHAQFSATNSTIHEVPLFSRLIYPSLRYPSQLLSLSCSANCWLSKAVEAIDVFLSSSWLLVLYRPLLSISSNFRNTRLFSQMENIFDALVFLHIRRKYSMLRVMKFRFSDQNMVKIPGNSQLCCHDLIYCCCWSYYY